MFKMLKMVSKKAWDAKLEELEMELDGVKARIKVSETYIKECNESEWRRKDEAYMKHREQLLYELPVLYTRLGKLNSIISWFKKN